MRPGGGEVVAAAKGERGGAQGRGGGVRRLGLGGKGWRSPSMAGPPLGPSGPRPGVQDVKIS